jgi:hypothetical protein
MDKNSNNDISSERRYQMHIRAFDLLEAGEEAEAAEVIGELLRLDPKEPLVDHIKGFVLSEAGC